MRVTAPNTFPFGAWHHVAFTADGAQLRLYLDGTQIASRDYLSDINVPEIPYLTIGARLNDDGAGTIAPDQSTPNFLAGPLDDVGLWTRALTPCEIQGIFDQGKLKNPLTAVVCEAPTTELGPLQVSLSGGNVTVTWQGGTLQTATDVAGPWSDSTATSPATEAATGRRQVLSDRGEVARLAIRDETTIHREPGSARARVLFCATRSRAELARLIPFPMNLWTPLPASLSPAPARRGRRALRGWRG